MERLEQAEWLEARRRSIGGSELASIMGHSRWGSPLKVYYDKLGLVPDEPSTLRLEFGLWAEEFIAFRTIKRLKELDGDSKYEVYRTPKGMMNTLRSHSAHPDKLVFEVYDKQLLVRHMDFLECHATIDGVLENITTGAAWIFEAKTSGTWMQKEWHEGTPQYYKSQCFHNAAVCGMNGAMLAVMMGAGEGFEMEFIPAPERPLDNLEFAAAWFQRHIIDQEAPDALPQDSDVLKKVFPDGGGPRLDAPNQLDAEANAKLTAADENYEGAHEAEKDAKQHKEGIKNIIKQAMGESDEILLMNGTIWTNKKTTRGYRSLKRKPLKKS